AGGNRSRRQQPRGAAIAQLMRVGSDQDRYGRVVAFVRIGDSQQSIQEILVEQGQARVAARIGDKAGADILLRSERVARAARRGLWADPNFAPLRPEHLDRIAAVRGQFALVEGKVLSVRESGATIYLNFGRWWTRDFTVTILKRHRRDYAAAGIDPKGLEGRLIRVRGWVEHRGGPVIESWPLSRSNASSEMRMASMGTLRSGFASRALLVALAAALAACTGTSDTRLISLPVPQASSPTEVEPATQREQARILATYGGEYDNAHLH